MKRYAIILGLVLLVASVALAADPNFVGLDTLDSNVAAGVTFTVAGVVHTGTAAKADGNALMSTYGGTLDANGVLTWAGGLWNAANVTAANLRRGVTAGVASAIVGLIDAASTPAPALVTNMPAIPATTLTLNTWVGDGNADGNSWDTARLWSLGHVPTVTEMAVLNQAGTYKCRKGLDANQQVGGLRINSSFAAEPNWTNLYLVSRLEANERSFDLSALNAWYGSVITWVPTYDSNNTLTLTDTKGAMACTLWAGMGFNNVTGDPYSNGKHLRGQMLNGTIHAYLANCPVGSETHNDENLWLEGRFSGTLNTWDANIRGIPAGSCITLHAGGSIIPGGVDGNVTGLTVNVYGQWYPDLYAVIRQDGAWDTTSNLGAMTIMGGSDDTINWNPASKSLGGYLQGFAPDGSITPQIRVKTLNLWGTAYVFDGGEIGATATAQHLQAGSADSNTLQIGTLNYMSRNGKLIQGTQNSVQTVTVTATGGTYTLNVMRADGVVKTTGAINFGDTTATIVAAINTALGSTATSVVSTQVVFSGNGYAGCAQPAMTVNTGSLTGGTATVTRSSIGGPFVKTLIGTINALYTGGGGGPVVFP